VKSIGFLSFGHWSRGPGSLIRTAEESILATIDLAVAAEEVGSGGEERFYVTRAELIGLVDEALKARGIA
jgi:hypothetical protein